MIRKIISTKIFHFRSLLFRYFESVDRQYPGSKLPDPQEALSKQVLSSAIFVANSKVAVLQPSAGAKVRGTYLKMSAKKAEIGKRAAEHAALATIRY